MSYDVIFMIPYNIITYEVKSNYEIVKSVAKLKFEILLSSGISLCHLRCHFLNVISNVISATSILWYV